MSDSVIYTVILGGYDTLKDPIIYSKDIDYICFTDDVNLKSKIWKIVIVDPINPQDLSKSSRFIKICAHKFLGDYEYSLYIDGSMSLKSKIDIRSLLKGKTIAVETHPDRDCIYDEEAECIRLGRVNSDVIKEQTKIYRQLGFPCHGGLYANWVIARKHNDVGLIKLCEEWWTHVLKYSKRDQISFPVVFKDYPIETIPTELRKRLVSLKKHSASVIIVSRAIYISMGDKKGLGILTEKRLRIMQRYFINSLKNQTSSNFVLYLIVGSINNETVKRIKSLDWGDLDVRFIYINDNLFNWKSSITKSKNWGQEKDFGCPEDIVRKSNHPITSIMARLDTDDWVAPGWIAHMKHMAATKSESHFLINYQVIGQAPDGRLYNFSNTHNRDRTSPFIALVQKKGPRISPYREPHLNMGKLFASVYNIPPSYVFMVVHGENRSNRFYQKDRYFEDVEIIDVQKEAAEVIPMRQNKLNKQDVQGTDWQARIAQANAL